MRAGRLRVLLVSGSLTPMKCGVGDYTAHLAGALAALPDVDVCVLTSRGAREQSPDLPFDVEPIAEGWSIAEAPRILSAIRRWSPGLVHMQFPTQGYGAGYLPWLIPAAVVMLRIPVVQTWHEYYPAGSGRRNLLNALTPGGLIVVRPHYLEQMPGWYRRIVSRKHVRLIPNAAVLPSVTLSNEERLGVKARLGVGSRSLVVCFGFVYPAKGVETLFDIADPEADHCVLVADLNPEDPYHARVLARMRATPWNGRPRTTGFLPEHEAATVLAAADAVVLPFVEGGDISKTSVSAASKQGAFVLTTSRERRGFVADQNVYYAAPGDLHEMRVALREHIGRRGANRPDHGADEWRGIAQAHREVYAAVLGEGRRA